MPQLDLLVYASISLEATFSLWAMSYLIICVLPFVLTKLVSYELILQQGLTTSEETNLPEWESRNAVPPVTYVTFS